MVNTNISVLVEMILLMLFASLILVDAKISINVTVHSNKRDVLIKYSGNDAKVITPKEINIFNITTERLNKGVRVELGKVPDSIFLKDPTDFGDTYQMYKWEPVRRNLKVKRITVVDVVNEDYVLKSHEYINNSTTVLKSRRNMFSVVENTAQSMWSAEGLPNDNIPYNINISLGYGHLDYESKWRSNKIHAVKLTLGVNKQGDIFIKPFQTVVTKLVVTKAILVIDVEYKAELFGAVIANYAQTYGKYHFWAPSVKNIMKAANMTNEIITREQIEVRCFINPRLEVYDKVTKEIVEPPRKRWPKIRLLRNKNSTTILYTRLKQNKKVQKKKR